MIVKKIVAKSKKLEGNIIITYHDDVIYSLIIDFKIKPTSEVWKKLFDNLPLSPNDTDKLSLLGLEIITDRANDRIALFCSKYSQKIGLKYKISKADAGKMKDLVISTNELEKVLEIYFNCTEWWAKQKSISNFIKHFNELTVLAAGITTSKYPNEWDKEFESKLKNNELTEYWAHLRNLGYEPIKRGGYTIKWEKKMST